MPVQNVEFLATFRALDQGQLAEDPRFADQTSRARHRTELRELMEFAYRQFTTDELAIRFEAEDVPYSLVNDRADVINDPQVEAMQALLTYQHPQAGLVRTPRPAAQYSNTPSNIRIHTPSLGEHNHSILSELGYSETEIASLQEDHIVQTGDSGQ